MHLRGKIKSILCPYLCMANDLYRIKLNSTLNKTTQVPYGMFSKVKVITHHLISFVIRSYFTPYNSL